MRGPRNLSRTGTEAPSTRRAGKEPVPEYNSDSDTAPDHASDSNPLFGFYSDSAYEFDFGYDPKNPESEDNSTEQPLLGPGSGLVITSTPAGRFVYWPDRKPVDVTPRIRKSESLYHRDSPWISGYRVQNVSQINTQSHTSLHIKIIVH
jgi:hypothetical protein